MSVKMATNQLKISQKFDLDSSQGIYKHRELILLKNSQIFSCNFTDCIQNRQLNLHVETVYPYRDDIVYGRPLTSSGNSSFVQ